MTFKKNQTPWNKGKKYDLEFKRLHKFGSPKGIKRTKEQIIAMSRRSTGSLNPNFGKGFHGILFKDKPLDKKEEIKLKISKTLTGRKQSIETIEKRMVKIRGRKQTPEERQNHSLALRGKKKSIEHIMNIIKSKKLNPHPNKFKGKKIDEIYNIEKAQLIRKKIGLKSSEKFKDENFIKKILTNRKINFLNTKPERQIKRILDDMNIQYIQQFRTKIKHAYNADFFIPSLNLIIECDGNYWHDYPNGKELDHIRTKEMIDKGYKVLRLWESDIKTLNIDEFKQLLEVFEV